MANAQKWLDKQFPTLESRIQTKKIFVDGETFENPKIDWQLDGELDLSDFVNLEYLDLSKEKITKVKGLEKMEKLTFYAPPCFDFLNFLSPNTGEKKIIPDNLYKLFAQIEVLKGNNMRLETKLSEVEKLTTKLNLVKSKLFHWIRLISKTNL